MLRGATGGFRPRDLTTEYLVNPLGIDSPVPRLSWKTVHPERGQSQSAYRIRVASSADAREQADVWDSGEVSSNQSTLVAWGGPALESGRRYYWQVAVKDTAGRWSTESETAWFETGLLSAGDWQAEWIGAPSPVRGVAPLFRRELTLAAKPARARAYVCGLGYFELTVNGVRIGDSVLDPAWTDYRKRALYVTHDITSALRQGPNVIGVMLGEGWHGNDHRALIEGGTHRAPDWTDFPKLLLQSRIELQDGSAMTVCSKADGSWTVSTGPIQMNSVYDGETYDARREKKAWDTARFKPVPGMWQPARAVTPPAGTVQAQQIEPIRVLSERRAHSIANPRPGVYVYDFGQNMAGWVRLTVAGHRGDTVSMKFAEALAENGCVSQENLRMARSTDTYILKGKGEETWEPRFTYHGFRYVQVEGFPGIPTVDAVVAREVRSALEITGAFDCSNTLLNRIHECVQWTERSNFHGLPTDCPQRDERMGWLNDMTVRAEETFYNLNPAAVFAKYEDDIVDTQDGNGAIADTAPYVWGSRPGDAVCTSFLLLPWFLYVNHGDRRILERTYDCLKAWNACLGRTAVNGIVQHSLYGDWASPALYCKGGHPWSDITPGQLMSTGYYFYNAQLLSKMATLLEKPGEAEEFRRIAGETAAAFNREYFHADTAQYALGSQASDAFALYLGIAPADRRADVVRNLVEDVEKRDCHVTTGNLCSRYILDVLSTNGLVDVAYRLATQTTYPSWGYMIENGATTIWERWEAATGHASFNMHSQNHPMYCSIDAWFYRTLAGIVPDDTAPAWERFDVKPHLPSGLLFVDAKVNTARGEVRIRWQRREKSILLQVTVPFNSTCRVWVPRDNPADDIFEGDAKVWTNGAFVPGTAGIQDARDEGTWVAFTVGSGGYCFQSRRVG